MADAKKLLSHLPPDTAEAVLSWLQSRGKDLPVHIPLATIKFSRECFWSVYYALSRGWALLPDQTRRRQQHASLPHLPPVRRLIDADNNGTLEPSELQAVFKALGRPASLQQVTQLVESVAGAGAQSLHFSDFAQMMHSAMSASRRGEAELRSLLQQEVNLQQAGARGSARGCGSGSSRGNGRRGGQGEGRGRGQGEPPLNWSNFHLLAKAFRRRVVLDGVINGTEGWREKVAALAERRAASSRAGVATAASVWRHRVQWLGQQQRATASRERTGTEAARAAGASGTPRSARGGGGVAEEESDSLHSAVSTGSTPRIACGPGIRIDADKGQGQRPSPPRPDPAGSLPSVAQQLPARLNSHATAATGEPSRHGHGSNTAHNAAGPAAAAAGGSSLGSTGGGKKQSYHDVLNMYVSGAAAQSQVVPGDSAAASGAADDGDAHGALDSEAEQRPRPATASSCFRSAGTSSSVVGDAAAPFSWICSAARIHLVAAASRRAAAGGDAAPGAYPNPTQATPTRLVQQTACSRARTGAGEDSSSASRCGRSSRRVQLLERAGKPAAQGQGARLMALALIKGQEAAE